MTYRLTTGDPIRDKTPMPELRERFKWEASLLWAIGTRPPTADEIADAMCKVLEEVPEEDT